MTRNLSSFTSPFHHDKNHPETWSYSRALFPPLRRGEGQGGVISQMSKNIDEQQVRHIAHLARLKLTDDEVAKFSDQLAAILTYIEKLSEVNTDGIEPTAHAVPMQNVFRDDVPAPSLGAEKVLANAPGKVASYFKVPKVLDQESA